MLPLVVQAFTIPSHMYFKSGKSQYVQNNVRNKNIGTVADTSGNYIESEEDMANTTRLDVFYKDNIVQNEISSDETSLTRPNSNPNRNHIKINDNILHEEIEEENISTSGQQPINGSNEKNIGIGGKDGLVYDLNKLKKNLVQEAVRQSKNELLSLLATPAYESESSRTNKNQATYKVADSHNTVQKSWDDLIEDKIAALVDANPGVSFSWSSFC